MANTKITELTQLTNPVSTDVLPIVDVGADVTKKISIADLLKNAAAGAVDAAGIAFDGDGNTGLYKPASDQLAVTTGGSQALLIDGNGNITAAGTSAAASFIPTSSTVPTNGLYLPAANSVAISSNGTQRLLIEADGDINIDSGGVFYDAANNRLAIGTTSPEQLLDCRGSSSDNIAIRVTNNETGVDTYLISTGSAYSNDGVTSGCSFLTGDGDVAIGPFSASKTLQFINNGERARIDSSGRLLLGTSSARGNFFNTSFITSRLQVEDSTHPVISCTKNANEEFPSYLVLAKTRGTGNTIVNSGDSIGAVSFQGNDGSEFVGAAEIVAQVDGTPGTNDMPGRLVFSVTADGASSPTEAMRIKNTRVINFSNAPVYADNAAAKTGGLVDGDVYRKSDGTLMIVYT